MARNIILAFVVILSTALGRYDVTTVYRFNSLEVADESGDITRTYLDTCSVSVHPESEAIGLPLVNIRANTTHGQSLIYPCKTPAIPTLEHPYETSQWETITALGEKTKLQITEINYFKHSPILEFWNHLLKQDDMVICEALEGYRNPFYIGLSFHDLFTSDDLEKVNAKENVFLRVQVEPSYYRNFQFRFKKNNNEYEDTCFKVDASLNIVSVCQGRSECEKYSFQSNDVYKISLYISLDGNLVIYDGIGKEYLSHGLNNPSQSPYYNFIDQYGSGYGDSNFSREKIQYQIVQIYQRVLSDNMSIVTPWVSTKNELQLSIIYYRDGNAKLQVYLRNKNSGIDVRQNTSEQVLGKQNFIELVLVKVTLKRSQSWSQEDIEIKLDKNAYIKNLWEMDDAESYDVQEDSTECSKYKISDIYKTALKDNTNTKKVDRCMNGGIRKNNSACICPPGFAGDSCDVACGKNFFGRECSNLCSETNVGCKGMILCTPDHGCSCAPGYYGDKCLLECAEGNYGSDCKQRCSCSAGCDRYTGNCKGLCDSPYLIWPLCQYYHSYWTESPVIKDSNYTSIKMVFNFNCNNVKKYPDATLFFLVQHKEVTATIWNNGSYEAFNLGYIDYVVDELKPGRQYIFRLLLIDKLLNTNDPDLSQTAIGRTKCEVSKIENNLNAINVTNSSMSIVWNKETESRGIECPFTSYILEITASSKKFSQKARKIFNITQPKLVIKDLMPGSSYLIRLKKNTVNGESVDVSNIIVQTSSSFENSLKVRNITAHSNGSEVYLEWFKMHSKKAFIKYMLIKRLACNEEEASGASLQMISTTETSHTLNLEPNAQYVVFVTTDATQTTSVNNVTATTGGKVPSVSPQWTPHNMKTTNETALIYWTDSVSSCTKMNGFFKKYMVELLDNQNNILNTYHTNKKQLEITNLIPRTSYTIRIRYVNHIGFNAVDYSEHKFTTKATSFLSPQNLTAYKTTASFIGLRWTMPESNTSITGVVVNVQNHMEKNSFNVTDLSTLGCKAWPSCVCYTVQKLRHNTMYDISIDILSEEFPEGGSQKTIQATTRETIASAVTEIKVHNMSMPNMTLSWKIPFVLNGILRKFQIEIEHLSSFDDSLCCRGVSTITHIVKEEQEFYSHVLDSLDSAFSYQVTIRAFTRRLGQAASIIIETPPPLLRIRNIPKVTLYGTDIELLDNDMINETSNDSNMSELATNVLVIVQSNTQDEAIQHAFNQTTRDLDSLIETKHWWIAHVCKVNDNCTVKLGTNDESDTPYGKVINKALTVGNNFSIAAVQINKYLSATSYTMIKSAPFIMAGDEIMENTSTNVSLSQKNDEEKKEKQNEIILDVPTPKPENNLLGQEDTEEPPFDYEMMETTT